MNKVIVKNSKAKHNYDIIEKKIAGLVLLGSDIKSIRLGKVSIQDSFVIIDNKLEAILHNIVISKYQKKSYKNYNEKVNSNNNKKIKLLMNKYEIKRWENKTKGTNLNIIPLSLFINDKGYAKLEIAIAKKLKKHELRSRDKEKSLDRRFLEIDF